MKVLLVAVNAKYIHSCPAVYSLKAYAEQYGQSDAVIEIAEYTINDRYGDILADIVQRNADVIAFSTYIWNVERVKRLMSDIRKIRGRQVIIWAGGPESTYAPEKFLVPIEATAGKTVPEKAVITGIACGRYLVDVCLLGEGEEIFTRLTDYESDRRSGKIAPSLSEERLKQIQGLALPEEEGIFCTPPAPPVKMDKIPFLYQDLSLFDNRIIYYESGRGCPYRCAYCLSSIDRSVRFRDIDIVKKELQFFLDHHVRQVKFVDRTFNCRHEHAMEIWQYIKEHDNGITNFHFEIEAALITEEELACLVGLRPGLIQMEIGIQSVHEPTLRLVNRRAEIDKIAYVVGKLREKNNINLHLDLIAGLPEEDMEQFKVSFDRVYAMRADQLQVGFLKVLKGTEIDARRQELGIVASAASPYQVLKTKWLTYEELVQLERISDMVELFYNSRFFIRSLPYIERLFDTPFSLYQALSDYYREHGFHIRQPAAQKRYDIMREFVRQHLQEMQEKQEQSKEEREQAWQTVSEFIDFDKALHFNKSRHMQYTQIFTFPEGKMRCQFDYEHRNPVNGEAACVCELI